MTRLVEANEIVPETTRYSTVAGAGQAHWLDACRALTTEVRDGLDLSAEIRTAHTHGHGDSVFLTDGSRMEAVALCEYGPKSPAGAGSCLIRFAAVRPSSESETRFSQLLAACGKLAGDEGLS